MKKSVHGSTDPVSSALVDTVVAARWEANEILSRRSSVVAADLLRGHAGELVHSCFGRDQIRKLALEAAALDVEKGRSPLELGALFYFSREIPTAGERDQVRMLIGELSDMPADPGEHLVPEFVRRLSSEELTDDQLCIRLHQEADLHEALWDDPRLTAEPQVRLMMLRSVGGLRERAAQLNPNRVQAARRADRRSPSSNSRSWRWAGSRHGIYDFAVRVLCHFGFATFARSYTHPKRRRPLSKIPRPQPQPQRSLSRSWRD